MKQMKRASQHCDSAYHRIWTLQHDDNEFSPNKNFE